MSQASRCRRWNDAGPRLPRGPPGEDAARQTHISRAVAKRRERAVTEPPEMGIAHRTLLDRLVRTAERVLGRMHDRHVPNTDLRG